MGSYITGMKIDDDMLLSEQHVEGTYFDPAYFLRWIEAQQVGLWQWAEEWQSYYWDQFAHENSRPHC